MKRSLSFKNTLLVSFILVTTLPFIAVSFWGGQRLSTSMEADATRKNSVFAVSIAHQLEEILLEKLRDLSHVAVMLDEYINAEEYNEYLAAFIKEYDDLFDVVKVLNHTGTVTNIAPYDSDNIGLDMSNQNYFKDPRTTKKPYWSKTFVSMFTGTPTLVLSIPLSEGVLVAHINLSKMKKITDAIELGTHGYSSIVDSKGVIIAHPNPENIYQRVSMSHMEHIQQGIVGKNGTYRYRMTNIEMIVSVAHVSLTGWVVSVAQSTEEIFAPKQEIQRLVFTWGIFAIAMAILISIICLHYLLTPLTNLVGDTQKISDGDYSIKFRSSIYMEINKLIQSFTAMIDSVREREGILHKEILERKQAEDNLKINEMILNKAQEIAHIGSWHLDIKKNILTWSDETYRICGLTPQEFGATYEAFLERLHPDDVDMVNKSYTNAIENKNSYENVHRMVRPDGSVRTVHVKSEDIVDENGETIHSFGITHDITERVQEEIRYKNIIETSIDGFWAIDTNGAFLEVNDSYCSMTGYSQDELLNMAIIDVEADQSSDEITKNLQNTINNGSGRFETRHKRKDGNVIDVEVSAIYTTDDNGIFFVFLRDITERKKAEKEKKNLEIQLQQAQRIESIGQLAGGIAHDFNNILYPIIGFTQLSQSELPEHHPIQENLADILDGAKRARDLVKRILLFSRQKEQTLKPVLIQPVIEESHKLLRSTIPANISMSLDLYGGEDYVFCDTSEIHEVILNLCTNAYHAIAKDNGKIIIALNKQNPTSNLGLPPDDYLCLSVRDNGVGIPESIKDKIFEPYVTTKDVGKGSGLGLSVVYGIIKNFKGGISVKSDPQNGTDIKIFLPISKPPVDIDKSNKNKNSTRKSSERILFVDDEKSIVKLGVRALEKQGYKVTGLQRSTDAFRIFKANPTDFDLVISDMAMPDMTGSELSKKLLDIRPDIPIIICSGYSEKLDTLKAKELKIKAVIDKPLLIEDLHTKVREVLDYHRVV